MNLKELTSPVRMYWDTGSGTLPESDCRRIADEIAACKILTLQITETSSTISHSTLAVLDALKNKNIALSLVLPLIAWSKEAFELIHGFRIKLLLISTSSFGKLNSGVSAFPAACSGVSERIRLCSYLENRDSPQLAAGSFNSVLQVQDQVAGKYAFGVAFTVKRENFRELPEVLKFCIDHQMQNLVLPMQRLAGQEEAFSLSPEERRDLTAALSRVERPARLKVVIHDPFLWRAFFPSVEFTDGGCQAANTMLYISPAGDVYPCPTLPIKIGSLAHSSLKDVIGSGKKKEVRKEIVDPGVCASCLQKDQCRGGCRGRAYSMKKSLNECDPVCK